MAYLGYAMRKRVFGQMQKWRSRSACSVCAVWSGPLLSAYRIIGQHIEGWVQDCSNSNIFLKPLFKDNFDPFVNNANLGAIAHTSNGT